MLQLFAQEEEEKRRNRWMRNEITERDGSDFVHQILNEQKNYERVEILGGE